GIMGVSVQGSANSVPGDGAPTMLAMDPYMSPKDVRYLDIYTRASGSFTYSITSSASYVTVSPSTGTLNSNGVSDARAIISVNWDAAPAGRSTVTLTVSRGTGQNAVLSLPLNKVSVPAGFSGFVESNGAISI